MEMSNLNSTKQKLEVENQIDEDEENEENSNDSYSFVSKPKNDSNYTLSEDSKTELSLKNSVSNSVSNISSLQVKGMKNKATEEMQRAINDINYGVAQLIDIRMDVTRNTSDAFQQQQQQQASLKVIFNELPNSRRSRSNSLTGKYSHDSDNSKRHKAKVSPIPTLTIVEQVAEEAMMTPAHDSLRQKHLTLRMDHKPISEKDNESSIQRRSVENENFTKSAESVTPKSTELKQSSYSQGPNSQVRSQSGLRNEDIMTIQEPAGLRRSISQGSKIIEETEPTDRQRESMNFKPENQTAGTLSGSLERQGINSYVNWLESRLIQKNKTSTTVDKKRDIIIRKKKKKTDSRNAYLSEIETQIKNMKNQNTKQLKTLTNNTFEVKDRFALSKKIEKMEQVQKFQNLKIFNQDMKNEHFRNYKVQGQTQRLTEKLNKFKKQKNNNTTISSLKSQERGLNSENLKVPSQTQSRTYDNTIDDQQGSSSIQANDRYKCMTFPSNAEAFNSKAEDTISNESHLKLDNKSPVVTRNDFISFDRRGKTDRPIT